MEVYSYYHFISFHFICWWTCAIPSVVWFTAEKRHWASGRLGNDLSDKKQMKAGNISGWKKNRKSLASWWLNQPIWKTYARQIGSVPQFRGEKKNMWIAITQIGLLNSLKIGLSESSWPSTHIRSTQLRDPVHRLRTTHAAGLWQIGASPMKRQRRAAHKHRAPMLNEVTLAIKWIVPTNWIALQQLCSGDSRLGSSATGGLAKEDVI